MNDSFYNPLMPEAAPEAPKPRRSPLLAILIGVLVVIVALAAVVVIDPFQWNVVGNIKVLLGLGGDPVAASIPSRPTMFIGVDLLNIQPEKLDRLYKPFAQVIDPAGGKDAAAGLKDLDKQLKDAIDMTVTDDIMPWAGRSAGLAIMDLDMGSSGTLSNATIIFSIQSRNNGLADQFLKKLVSNSESKNHIKFSENTYSGVTIYSYKPDTGGSSASGIAFCRSGDVVLFSLTQAGIQDAIDAQKGDSLSKDSAYQSLAQQLPGNRFMTMYIDMEKYKDTYLKILNSSAANSGLPPNFSDLANAQMGKIKGTLVSLSIVDAGLQMDSVAAYDVQKMTDVEKKAISQVKSPSQSIAMLPEDTLFYVGGNILNETWVNLIDQIATLSGASKSEFEQSMAELEKQINLNPTKDLFPYLGGDILLAGVPSTQGLLQQAKLNLGAAIMIESTDEQKMTNVVDKLSAALKDQGGIPADSKKAGDLSYYSITDPNTEKEMFAFGVGRKYLLLGTGGGLLEELFSLKTPLTSSSRYQAAVKTLPGGSSANFYLDLEATLANVRESMSGTALKQFDEQVKFLKPIPAVIAGGSMVGQDMVKSTIVILVNAAK